MQPSMHCRGNYPKWKPKRKKKLRREKTLKLSSNNCKTRYSNNPTLYFHNNLKISWSELVSGDREIKWKFSCTQKISLFNIVNLIGQRNEKLKIEFPLK